MIAIAIHLFIIHFTGLVRSPSLYGNGAGIDV